MSISMIDHSMALLIIHIQIIKTIICYFIVSYQFMLKNIV